MISRARSGPDPGPGRAVAVNPIDLKIRSGRMDGVDRALRRCQN
jgi:hypothetical protein